MTPVPQSGLAVEVAEALRIFEELFDDPASEFYDGVDPRDSLYPSEYGALEPLHEASISLPRCDADALHVHLEDILQLAEEVKTAKLVDKSECWGNQRVFLRIACDKSYSDMVRLEHLAELDEPICVEDVSGVTYSMYIRSGVTLFGLAVTATGNWCREFPPAYPGECFVEVVWYDPAGGGDALSLVKGLIFELNSTLQLPVYLTHHPMSDEAEEYELSN